MQPDLFGADEVPDPHLREDRRHETLNTIRAKFGKGTIQRGLHRHKQRPPLDKPLGHKPKATSVFDDAILFQDPSRLAGEELVLDLTRAA